MHESVTSVWLLRSLPLQSRSFTKLSCWCFAGCHSSHPSCLLAQLLIRHKLRREFTLGFNAKFDERFHKSNTVATVCHLNT